MAGQQSTHPQSCWASGDAADGTTAGFCSRNKVRAYAKRENLALSILKNQTTDPQRKRQLWVCYPLQNQICPGSSSQPISFCKRDEMKITTENEKCRLCTTLKTVTQDKFMWLLLASPRLGQTFWWSPFRSSCKNFFINANDLV